MQPYFFPYAGYFRLLSECDEFVILDCVQFQRRGRIHRAPVPSSRAGPQWLTLPLKEAPVPTKIADIEFAVEARNIFDERIARFPWIARADGPAAPALREFLYSSFESPVNYLERGLRLAGSLLGLRIPVISRSSTLGIAPQLRGQERIITIAKTVGASRYLNSPGGRGLYDGEAFARNALDLAFLDPYEGPHRHLLFDLMHGQPREIGSSLSTDRAH